MSSSGDHKRRRTEAPVPSPRLATFNQSFISHITAPSPVKLLLSGELSQPSLQLTTPNRLSSPPQSLSSLYSNRLFPLGPPSAQTLVRTSPFSTPSDTFHNTSTHTPFAKRLMSPNLHASQRSPENVRTLPPVDTELHGQVDLANPLLSRRLPGMTPQLHGETGPLPRPSLSPSEGASGETSLLVSLTPRAPTPTEFTSVPTPTNASSSQEANLSSLPPPPPPAHTFTTTPAVASALSETVRPRRACKCKNSACLKMYCDCFANGSFCDGCDCKGCNNKPYEPFRTRREDAMAAILERNPLAFAPKVAVELDASQQGTIVRVRGCRCRKSHCEKRYCECFEAGVPCGPNCTCHDCRNGTHAPHHQHLHASPPVAMPAQPSRTPNAHTVTASPQQVLSSETLPINHQVINPIYTATTENVPLATKTQPQQWDTG